MNLIQLRQGDVQIQQVAELPAGCTPIAPDGNRIVLMHGEVTGHAHAIYDYMPTIDDMHDAARMGSARAVSGALGGPSAADEIADAAIARAQTKARLWRAPDGIHYLEVTEPVTLRHEEHTQHSLPPGIYKLPTQVEYTPSELRRVAD